MDFDDFAPVELGGEFDDSPFHLSGMDNNGFSGMGMDAFSTASLPALDALDNDLLGFDTIVRPNELHSSSVVSGGAAGNNIVISSTSNHAATYCFCCTIFLILFILFAALIAMGILILVKVFDISYDVNHLSFTIQQPLIMKVLPSQILYPTPGLFPPEVLSTMMNGNQN